MRNFQWPLSHAQVMTTTIEIELQPGTNDYTPSVSSGLGLTTSPLVLKENRVRKTKGEQPRIPPRPTPWYHMQLENK